MPTHKYTPVINYLKERTTFRTTSKYVQKFPWRHVRQRSSAKRCEQLCKIF